MNQIEVDMSKIEDRFNLKLLTIKFDKIMFQPISSCKNYLPNYKLLEINNY